MSEPANAPEPTKRASATTTFNDLIKDVARRNEEAHREALKQRAASGRAARDLQRARDLR
jgi:hypothetical protein